MRQRQGNVLRNAGEEAGEFIKLLNSFRYGVGTYTLFQDFCEISALSIANSVSFSPNEERGRREGRYLAIVEKYKDDETNIFAKMLSLVVLAFEADSRQDFLGRIFMLADFGEGNLGQFFTPYHVSAVMGRMTFDTARISEEINKKGFLTACDPCVGAGGMLIAAFNAAKEIDGINPQTQILFHGIDISPQAIYMAYIQCSLLGMSGIFTIGNSLTMEFRETFFTPFYCLNFWRFKKQAVSEETDLSEVSAKIPLRTVTVGKQLMLFGDDD